MYSTFVSLCLVCNILFFTLYECKVAGVMTVLTSFKLSGRLVILEQLTYFLMGGYLSANCC